HLLQRDEKVREVHPPLRARFSLETLCGLRIHGGGRLLHQGHHVALAQDPARHAHRVEGFQLGRSMLRPYVFPDADEFDRHAGHTMNRERRPAPRVTVELGQDRAGQPDALLKAAGASTSRTTGTVLTSSCLICDRLPGEPPDRRFAQALSSPFLKRAAAALLSHSVYHTSASPPALPPRFAFLRPSTR